MTDRATDRAYGSGLGRRFRLRTPALVTRALGLGEIAVTHLRCDAENHGLTAPFAWEDAYLVGLQIRAVPDHALWVDGRPAPKRPFAAGTTSFYDLRRDPVADIRSPFHALMIYLPRPALDAIADHEHAARVDELRHTPGVGVDDPVVRGLGMSLLPAFDRAAEVSRLFVEGVTLAIGAHVARAYGGMRAPPPRGGLAAWQERRVEEMIDARLDGDLPLAGLADACGLSVGHFARAFRRTTGMAPHRWLLQRRVERARHLLATSRLALSEIALACGFADQSHFTRVFTRLAGTSPGAWRRAHGRADAAVSPDAG